MASWKWPAVLNKMLHDIPGINVLLNALLKQDVTGTTDVPAGAKQWVDTPEGKQFQVFNGQSWSSVGKLDHDAASVDGYDASPTVLKNTIPVRDASGKLPGDITGNAATATKAGALSAVNPVEMGGTGGNTPEQARRNLGVPPTDHSSTGTDYGLGNATEYGHNKLSDATDIDLGADGGTAATPLAVKTAKAEAITAASEALEAFAETQAQKDAAQDAKIAEAQSSADAAGDSAAVSFEVDGLDLVITYGNGAVERVKLPTGKGVGDLWWGHDPKSVPANVQLYSGQLLSRSAYEAHSALVLGGKRTVVSESEWQSYASAHGGMCPYYSSGDESTTYRMPCIKGVHPKFVAALAEAGQYVAAGAPNITGEFQQELTAPLGPPNLKGVFYLITKDVQSIGAAGTGAADLCGFDASRCSSVYRDDCDTIQPPALTFLLGEYVVGSVAVVGEADAESLLAGQTLLDAKVGVLENGVGKSSAYITETWVSGASWYRKWSDGWIEQGGTCSSIRGSITVTLHKAFTNALYDVRANTIESSAYTYADGMPWVLSRTTSNFSVSSFRATECIWKACGY